MGADVSVAAGAGDGVAAGSLVAAAFVPVDGADGVGAGSGAAVTGGGSVAAGAGAVIGAMGSNIGAGCTAGPGVATGEAG